jgi:hypothetical protein
VSNPFVLCGVGFGIILALAYFALRLKAGKKRDVEDVIGVFGYAVGVLSGLQVCWVSYIERATPPIDKISFQMFMGGFALILFAINKIVKKFQED